MIQLPPFFRGPTSIFRSAVRTELSPFFASIGIPTLFAPRSHALVAAFFPSESFSFVLSRGFNESCVNFAVGRLPPGEATTLLERCMSAEVAIGARSVFDAFGVPPVQPEVLPISVLPSWRDWHDALHEWRDRLERMRGEIVKSIQIGAIGGDKHLCSSEVIRLAQQISESPAPVAASAWLILSVRAPHIVAGLEFPSEATADSLRRLAASVTQRVR